MTVCLSVTIGGFSSKAVKESFLFTDMNTAKEVFDRLTKQTGDYHSRSNDRERFCTFDYLMGSATVDVSNALAIEVEDPFGEHAEILSEWNRKMGELRNVTLGKVENPDQTA